MDAEPGRTSIGFSVGPATVDAVLRNGTTVTLTGLDYVSDIAGSQFAVGQSSSGLIVFANQAGDNFYQYLKEDGTFASWGGPTHYQEATVILHLGDITQPAVIAWLEAQGQPVIIP